MQFTKLEHSGCVVEKNGQKIVCDPVEFVDRLPELEKVVAVVITHKHGDHLQQEKLMRIMEQNPEARVLTTSDAASEVPHAEIVRNGDLIEVGGFRLRFFGKNHAAIIDGVIPCENIGVVIDEKVVNPGDSFDIPDNIQAPGVLLVPSAAPWCKVAEGMNYIQAVRPKIVIPVHNAVLSGLGDSFNNNWLKSACEKVGADFRALRNNESMEV